MIEGPLKSEHVLPDVRKTNVDTIAKQLLIGESKYGPIFVDVIYKDGKLSFTGVEGPLKNGNAKGGAGQITIDPNNITEFSQGWNYESVAHLAEVWKQWHLNNMRGV